MSADVGQRPPAVRPLAGERAPLGGVAVGLIGLGAVLALEALLPAGPSPFDETRQGIVKAAYPTWASAALDRLASLPVVAVLLAMIAIWFWVRGHRGLALAAVVSGLVKIPTEAIKLIVDRPRPPGAAIEAFGSVARYPSGHTVRAVVVARLVVLACLEARHGRDLLARAVGVVALATVAALLGLARIASGDHWPTDVVGGAILGAAWLGVAAAVGPRIAGSRRSRSSSDDASGYGDAVG